MRVGVAQVHTHPGDLAGTVTRIEAQARAAAERGVELLVFPVPTIAGPWPLPYGIQDAFLLDALHQLEDLAGRVACPCLVPLVIDVDDRAACEAVLLRDGTASPLRLSALAALTVDDEGSAEDAPTVVELDGMRLGLAFYPDEIDALLRDGMSVDAVIYLARFGFAVDDSASALGHCTPSGRPLLAERAFGAWLVGVDAVGGYGAQVFTGSSFVSSPHGTLVAQAPAFEEALLVADVGGPLPEGGVRSEPYDARYHLWQALSLGLRDHVEALGAGGVVLALDGSLLSSVLAVLASDALGPTRVHALLTAEGSSAREAATLTRRIHVEARAATAPPDIPWLSRRDAGRLELAAWARQLGALCLLPLDKTGIALEADDAPIPPRSFAPLADVWRSDVVDIAHFRNAISPVFVSLSLRQDDVPASISAQPDISLEMLLGRADDALAAHLSGTSHRLGSASSRWVKLAEEVVRVWRANGPGRSVRVPCLAMSTTLLAEVAPPPGFGWDGGVETSARAAARALEAEFRRLVGQPDDDAQAVEARHLIDGFPFAPSSPSMLSETFDLLRDLSAGSGTADWRNPFSEN